MTSNARSFVVGLVLGALKPRMTPNRQLLAALGVLLVTTLPLLLVGNVPALMGAIFLSGVAISPTFITAFGLIERGAPPEVLTEGVTWVMTGVGMALGAFVAGWVVDKFGPHSGSWVSVAAASLALAIVALGQCVLGEGRGRVAEA